jgi:hypothetical protein
VSIAWDETSRDLEVRRRTRYRVDIFLVATQLFQTYSANGIDKAMAESLAEHLKRNHSGGRIGEVPSGKIIKEWEGKTRLEFKIGEHGVYVGHHSTCRCPPHSTARPRKPKRPAPAGRTPGPPRIFGMIMA